MNHENVLNRRSLLKAAGLGAGAILASQVPAQAEEKPALKFTNEQFYKDGKFNEDAAKDAILKVLQYHGYPLFPGLREKIWISDYGLGQFATVGLAAVMWVNNEKDRYMMLDIYLLPNQMLPEHWHLPTDKNPVKMEGWLVRHGLSHIVGEGEPNLPPEIVIPKCHLNGTATVNHDTAAKPGDFVPLNRAEAHHWQFAGPEGAIITEVACVHDNNGVRHAEPKIKFP